MFKTFLSVISLVLISCFSPTEKPERIQNFSFKIDLKDLPSSTASISGELTNTNFDLIHFDLQLDTNSQTATATVESIPVGNWHLKVDAKNSDEMITHTAETDLQIQQGMNEVNLVFEAVSGDLVIHVGWDSSAEINLDSVFFQLWEKVDTTETLIPDADPKAIMKLFKPIEKYDKALEFKFLQSKYIRDIYADRYISIVNAEGNSESTQLVVNEEWPNTILSLTILT